MEKQSGLGWDGLDPKIPTWGEYDRITALHGITPQAFGRAQGNGFSFIYFWLQGYLVAGGMKKTWTKPPPVHIWERLGHVDGAGLDLNFPRSFKTHPHHCLLLFWP